MFFSSSTAGHRQWGRWGYGISSGIPTIALSGRNGADDLPTTSQPIEVIDTEITDGSVDFAFDDPDAGFHTVAEMSQVAVMVNWDGPLTVNLTNPSGAAVSTTLADWSLVPVTMEDDCETRRFEGEMSGGPVTVRVKAQTDSPGCD